MDLLEESLKSFIDIVTCFCTDFIKVSDVMILGKLLAELTYNSTHL